MNQVNGFVLLSSLLQPGLAGYALHLNRVFGSRKVGWWVFSAFLCLALLHLLHLLQLSGGAPGLIDVFISLLLLVGMAHTQSFCSGRAKSLREEKKLGVELQRVGRQAEELSAANKNLIQQLLAREQREQALKTSEQQWHQLFFDNPLPMWVFELSSLRFLSANEAALRAYGYASSQLTSRTARDLYAAEDISAFLDHCAKPLSSTAAKRLWRHRRKDGSVFEVEVMALDLLFEGRPARLLAAHDVSAWRQNQLEMLATQEVLNAQLLDLKGSMGRAAAALA